MRLRFILFGVLAAAVFSLAGQTAHACNNLSPLPGGFTAPCPVFSSQPSSTIQSGSVTVTATPGANQYISQQFYLYNGSTWTSYPFQGSFTQGYTTSTASYTLTPSVLGSLQGTIYLAEWDWTFNAAQGCFTGPGSTVCNQGSWRVQAFTVTTGSSGCASGLYQYCASTSTSENLIFMGLNTTTPDGVYHPLDIAPNVGGLYGANTCITDPDFGSKICRVTDYSMGTNGHTFNMGDDGDGNMWAADGSAFLVISNGGARNLFAFSNDSNMVSTMTDVGGIVPGGDSTHFASDHVVFSSVNPNTLYELVYNSTVNGEPFTQLNQLTLNRTGSPSQWTLTRTKLFNFETDSANCLPSNFFPNWAGEFNISSDDQSFQFAFSDNGQNGARDAKHPYGATLVANYTKGKGCRVLNTYGTNGIGPMTIWGDWGATGAATNGSGTPVGVSGGALLPDVFYLHEAGPVPDSAYAKVSGSIINSKTPSTTYSCHGITTNGLCENYTWEVATTNVRPDTMTGHDAKGNLYDYTGHQYTATAYHAPSVKVGALLTQTIPTDQHGSYHNADSEDDQPVFFVSTNVCDQDAGSAGLDTCDTQYTGPLYDEIVAVENQAAHSSSAEHCNYGKGPTACVYRFAHTFNTGTNWSFAIQNAIGNVSPTGKFLLFGSDWNLTLGCTNGASSGCLNNIAASVSSTCADGNLATTSCQRGDIFVVRLQ